MRYTLGKNEKLKSKKQIELLFEEGNRIKKFPLQLIYLQKDLQSDFPIKVGFSVPKRQIKLAVHRNRIKRLMREVYRKNKYLYSENLNNTYVFMFIYMANSELDYKTIEEALKKISSKFLNKINESKEDSKK
ncbi:ribonuclease P protein component [Lutibacter sp.]